MKSKKISRKVDQLLQTAGSDSEVDRNEITTDTGFQILASHCQQRPLRVGISFKILLPAAFSVLVPLSGIKQTGLQGDKLD